MRPIDKRTGHPTDEEAFRREMEAAGATVTSWENGPGDHYAIHSHSYRKVLLCLRGSIVFHLPEADVELGTGSCMVVDSGTAHSADVGEAGVRCVEAQVRVERRLP